MRTVFQATGGGTHTQEAQDLSGSSWWKQPGLGTWWAVRCFLVSEKSKSPTYDIKHPEICLGEHAHIVQRNADFWSQRCIHMNLHLKKMGGLSISFWRAFLWCFARLWLSCWTCWDLFGNFWASQSEGITIWEWLDIMEANARDLLDAYVASQMMRPILSHHVPMVIVH
jgi:hypothetical protein